MKNIKILPCKYLFLLGCFTWSAYIVKGQSLPSIQNKSVYSSKAVKVAPGGAADGFEAFNKVTGLYYTISNDKENLRLAIMAKDPLIVRKILYGITLTIGASAKNNIHLTFPSIPQPERDFIIEKQIKLLSKKDSTSKTTHDSLVNAFNLLAENYSFVKHTGLPRKDSLIKFNQDEELKIKGGLNNALEYRLELVVPLKYLKSAVIDNGTFKYSIKLNGRLYNTNTRATVSADGRYVQRTYPPDPNTRISTSIAIKATPEILALDFATDLSGKYTLFK